MAINETVLYEKFESAREAAVALTDRYLQTPPDAPDRDVLWDRVVRQTEAARALLQSYLARR